MIDIALNGGGTKGGIVDKDMHATRTSPTGGGESEAGDGGDVSLVEMEWGCIGISSLDVMCTWISCEISKKDSVASLSKGSNGSGTNSGGAASDDDVEKVRMDRIGCGDVYRIYVWRGRWGGCSGGWRIE